MAQFLLLVLVIILFYSNGFDLPLECYDPEQINGSGCCDSLDALCIQAEANFNCTPAQVYKGISSLTMSKCELDGTIPSTITGLTNLTYLDLSDNYLIGTMPAELGSIGSSLGGLIYLDLSVNSINGTIPKTISKFESMEYLDLHRNYIERMNIAEIVSMETLIHLDLSDNQIIDTFHETFGNLEALEYLNLGINKIPSTIPPTVGSLSKLKVLILERNDMIGELPFEITQVSNLEILNLGQNKLTGEIPSDWDVWTGQHLLELYLGENDLTCPVTDYSLYGQTNDFVESYGEDGNVHCIVPDNGGGGSSSSGLDGVEVAIIVIVCLGIAGGILWFWQRQRHKKQIQIAMLNDVDAFGDDK